MAVSGFKPVLGGLTLNTAGFTLSGDNAGFCDAILRKTAGSQPARLESLTYVLPGQTPEHGEGNHQTPMVVNLLMQLRASFDQNNVYLRTGQASQAQIMAQLRQTLAQSDQAVRAQAGAIERAVRNSLFQENEFRQALAQLEREVKKNEDRPGRAAMPARSGRTTVDPEPWAAGRTAERAPFSADRAYRQARRERDRQPEITEPGRPADQSRAQPSSGGYAVVPDGQATGGIDGRGRPKVFGSAQPKTAVPEEAGRDVRLSSALILAERAETVRERASERPVYRAESPQKAGRPTEGTDKEPHLGYQPSAVTEKHVGLPYSQIYLAGGVDAVSPDTVREVRRLPPSDEIRVWTGVEKASNYGGGRKFPARSTSYPSEAGFRVNVFRTFYERTFPIRPPLIAGMTGASPAFFVWSAGLDRASRTEKKRIALSGSALEWRWMVPFFQDESSMASQAVREGRAPRAQGWNGAVAEQGTRSRTEWNFRRGMALVRHSIFEEAPPLPSAATYQRRSVFRLRPDDIRALAVRHTGGDNAGSERIQPALRFAPRVFFGPAGDRFGEISLRRTLGMSAARFREATGPAQRILEWLTAVSAANMMPAPPGDKTLRSVDWLLPVLPAERRTYQMYPWLAAPGVLRMEGPGVLHSLPKPRARSGMGGDAILRWTDMASIVAGAVPTGQGNLPANSRMSSFAERLNPPHGRNIRFNSAPAPTMLFRTWDRQANPGSDFRQESGKNFPVPTDLRFASVPGESGFQTAPYRRLAADVAAVPERSPAGDPVSARSAQRTLWRTLTQPGESLNLPQTVVSQMIGKAVAHHALQQTGEKAFRVPNANALLWAEKTLPGGQAAAFTVGGTMLQTQSAPLPARTRAIWMGNRRFQIGVRMPQTMRGRLPVGTEEPSPEAFLTKADRNTVSSLPGLAHFASPLEPLESTLSDVPPVGRGEGAAREGGPAMIFRTPAPPAGKAPPSQEQEGEAVLAAQAVGPDQVRAMNRAFSYSAPAAAGGGESASGAQPEPPVTAAGQETRELNYNRLTEELLVRIERRLRAERRKFGL